MSLVSSPRRTLSVLVSATFITLSASIAALAQQPTPNRAAARIKVERSDQLPRHSYRVSSTALALLQDEKQFAELAQQLQADLRADLSAYDIQDRATLKSYYQTLSNLAVERADYRTAVAYQDSIRAIEDKPGLRLSTGLVERAMAAAARTPAEALDSARFREALRREIAALPYPQVQAELAAMKGRFEVLSPNMALGVVQARIEPTARSGSIPRELAQQLVAMRVLIDRIAPLRGVVTGELGRTITAHSVTKPDIWAARDVSLEGRSGLTPVTIAIWDSGVDVDLYPNQLFTNPGEIAGNGKDDDGNGYIDDVHGIAHDLDSARVAGLLAPLSLTPAEVSEYRAGLKGGMDVQAGLNTPEAEVFKRRIAATAASNVKSLLEKSREYVLYAHGTHVAGIALTSNPAARMLVARRSRGMGGQDQFKLPPLPPTLARARAFAQEFRKTIEYFGQHGVRVVNMSWGFNPRAYESMLAANNVGKAEDRPRLARQIFDIAATALHDAMVAAPNILFVAAAGNDDADVKFGDVVPASFDLPNLITVGAVDRAGDEAALSSYGKIDVYANGIEVPSRVPGGMVIPLSGTSMATPQVVNLAAKLLAVKPNLTVAELRRAIVESADEKTIGQGKRIKLLNPKAALERIAGR